MCDNATSSRKSELVAGATAVDSENSQPLESSSEALPTELTKEEHDSLAVKKASSKLKGLVKKGQNEQQQEKKQEKQ
jgi:hypothetical protein